MENTLDFAKAQDGCFFMYMNGKYAGQLETDEDTVIQICNAYNNTYGRGVSPKVIDEMYIALKQAHDDLSHAVKLCNEFDKAISLMKVKLNDIIQ